MTDGEAGLRVVRLLEAATESMASQGRPVAMAQAVALVIPFVDLQRAVPRRSSPRSMRRSSACSTARSSSSVPRSRPSSRTSPPICGTAEAVAVNSGTSALHLALLAAGVGRGDEVITVPVHVRRHGGGDRVRRRHGRCSSTSSRDYCTMDPAQLEAAITPRTTGDRAGAPLRAAGRHGSDPRHRAPPRPRGDRGRLPGARRRIPGPPLRLDGAAGLLQLLSGQEPRRLRRRRRRGDERSRRWRRGSACCAAGARRRSYEHRHRGVQLPHGRRPGRDPRREAAAPRARGPRRAARTPPSTGACSPTRRSRRRPSGRLAGTSITCTSFALPQRDALARRARRGRRADRRALSDSGAPAAGVPRSRLRARRLSRCRSGGAARCCRCRCFPS